MINTNISTSFILILANIWIFILVYFGNLSIYELGSSYVTTIYNHEYYRLITSAFCHKNPMHILCNMYSLYNIGNALESIIGSSCMLLVYFSSILLGGYISCLVHKSRNDLTTISIGASGAICGLLGTYSVIIFSTIGIDGLDYVMSSMVMLIFMGFFPSIDTIAHFSGLGSGVVIGLYMTYPYLLQMGLF